MQNADRVTRELREALTAYAKLDATSTAVAVVALFGVTNAKRLAPMLQEIAHNVQPGRKT